MMVNPPLGVQMPRTLRRQRKRPLTIAVDLTLLAYYGKHDLDDPQIYRGPAKGGTNPFFARPTARPALPGERFTLAVAPVTREEALKQGVQELVLVVGR